tara:strand:+ start:842 stop:1162 length:321 start_codon:yes stop_codon:yes gene_type:complete
MKENYNSFVVNPSQVIDVLKAFPSTKGNLEQSIIDVFESSKDESHSERVLLDDFTGVYIQMYTMGNIFGVRESVKFYIGCDDGMPRVYAEGVKKILDNEGIDYKLN